MRKLLSLKTCLLYTSSLPEGYNLSIISTTKDWVEVSDDNGTKGFVSAQYIDFKNGTKPANKTENATSAIKNTASTSSSSKLSNKRTYNGKTIDVNELIEYSKQFIGTPYVSVSYTHLDVYKRQHIFSLFLSFL